ncbi:MAG: glycosyltransferase [Chloroflexota bacterium]|nr:glycosyltransferase [Chloroflexota bacterium]MDQ5865458.1 glycosyltransferase [Chloroflexota bacterium]
MRILFLTPRFCYPLLKGDTSRVYHQLRELSREHEITLLSIAERPVSPDEYEQVAKYCKRVVVVPLPRWRTLWNLGTGLLSKLPLQVNYYRIPAVQQHLKRLLAEEQFDLLHVTLVRMLPYVRAVERPPVVVDLIDSLTLNLADRREQVSGPKRLAYEIEYRRMRDYEQAVVGRYPELIVTSPADKQALGGRDGITVLPMGVDLERFQFRGPDGRDAQTIIFTGNMGYHPNEEAVLWFAAEVWPSLRATHPQLVWQVVGTNPTERVRALAQPENGVEVLGWVPDVSDYLGRATISICPLRSGSGIQMKVQEAMSVGAPVVATSIANRGVGGVPGRDLLVADTADDFAAAVTCLLDNPQKRACLGHAGRQFVEQQFQWERHAEQLTAIYARLLGT